MGLAPTALCDSLSPNANVKVGATLQQLKSFGDDANKPQETRAP